MWHLDNIEKASIVNIQELEWSCWRISGRYVIRISGRLRALKSPSVVGILSVLTRFSDIHWKWALAKIALSLCSALFSLWFLSPTWPYKLAQVHFLQEARFWDLHPWTSFSVCTVSINSGLLPLTAAAFITTAIYWEPTTDQGCTEHLTSITP